MNPVLQPDSLAQRYKSTNSRLLTLWVTRQNEEFLIDGSSEQLIDMELLSSSVELVGEPGLGYHGDITGLVQKTDNVALPSTFLATRFGSTFGEYLVNQPGTTSTVLGITNENRIEMKPQLNHGHVNVFIEGMLESSKFIQDTSKPNRPFLTLPTDLGLMQARIGRHYPPNTIPIPNLKIKPKIKVQTQFLGTLAEEKRLARFVEDFADTDPSTYRNADGTVAYYPIGASGYSTEGIAVFEECIIPANCIQAMKLVFKITPRSTL